MTHITLVKKILSNGESCKKCREVSQRLLDDGLISMVNQTVLADERDSSSPGMVLAKKHKVTRAPFFIVEYDSGKEQVFDVYFKFRKAMAPSQTQATRGL